MKWQLNALILSLVAGWENGRSIKTKRMAALQLFHLHEAVGIRAKLHYTDACYEHQLRTRRYQRTPPTYKNLPHPNILACRDVGLWQLRCGKFVVELLWACPLVVFVAGVRSRCPCSGVWFLVDRTGPPYCRTFYEGCGKWHDMWRSGWRTFLVMW